MQHSPRAGRIVRPVFCSRSHTPYLSPRKRVNKNEVCDNPQIRNNAWIEFPEKENSPRNSGGCA